MDEVKAAEARLDVAQNHLLWVLAQRRNFPNQPRVMLTSARWVVGVRRGHLHAAKAGL